MTARIAPAQVLDGLLGARLAEPARTWLAEACAEVARGARGARFAALLSAASRHVKDRPLAGEGGDPRPRAAEALAGWNPERWTLREAARVRLVLARPDLAEPAFVEELEDLFRHADVGELCALYKSLCLLPSGERFAWRAGEGCRSNMKPVFESIACDNPYPARHLEPLAFRQLALKAVFVGAPLWRVHGLDGRIDAELARMALDLADERRSAGRPVPPELWSCLGAHAGARGVASLERELRAGDEDGRRAAAVALRRAGEDARLAQLAAADGDRAVRDAARAALAGASDSTVFRAFAGKDA